MFCANYSYAKWLNYTYYLKCCPKNTTHIFLTNSLHWDRIAWKSIDIICDVQILLKLPCCRFKQSLVKESRGSANLHRFYVSTSWNLWIVVFSEIALANNDSFLSVRYQQSPMILWFYNVDDYTTWTCIGNHCENMI